MATTAVSSASTAADALSTLQTKRANAQKVITALNAGSGVDVAALAQGLVDADRIPQENLINSKIDKNEARISGYSAISFMLQGVKDALAALKDANSFNATTVGSSNSAALGVTATTAAAVGNHSVQINSLLSAQRSISNPGFLTETDELNGGTGFSITLDTGAADPTVITLADGSDTPQGVVDAINAAEGLSVSAKLVNTGVAGEPYKIVLSGVAGSSNSFTLASDPVLDTLQFDELQTASDANLVVDGVTYVRTSNTVSDVIAGLTFDLKATTGTTAAPAPVSVTLTRDTAAVKEKINAFVTAYNEINQVLNEVTKADSTLDIYGGTLVGDSVARQVGTQLREMVTGVSSSPGTNIGALWQMGLNVDRLGVMTVDSTKLDAALTDNFADVVTMFTANQNNRTETSPPISTSTGFTGKFTQLNSGSAFSVSLVSSAGTVEIPIPVGSTTPQGIVDAIIAANLGYTAAIVKDPADNTQYKIMVAGGMGSAGFTLTAADDAGASISGLSFSGQGAGIAGDALRKISALLAPTGGLLTRSESASSQNEKFRERIAALQTRMQTLLDRYTRQFAAMESLVGNINSQKTSLQSSFDGMMAMYTNK